MGYLISSSFIFLTPFLWQHNECRYKHRQKNEAQHDQSGHYGRCQLNQQNKSGWDQCSERTAENNHRRDDDSADIFRGLNKCCSRVKISILLIAHHEEDAVIDADGDDDDEGEEWNERGYPVSPQDLIRYKIRCSHGRVIGSNQRQNNVDGWQQ